MIRCVLLAATITVPFCAPAHAQLGGVDIPGVGAISGPGQIVLDPTAVGRLILELQQLVATYNAIAHLTNVNGMAMGLMTPAVTNPFGGVTNLSGAIMGGGFGGIGAASGIAQQMLQSNRVYAPPGQDFLAQWMTARSQSLASSQALALQMMQSAQQRQIELADLQSQIAMSPDGTANAAIAGRINQEQHIVATQHMQAQQVLALAQQQQLVAQEQIIEKQRMDAEQHMADTTNLGALAGSAGAYGGFGSGGGAIVGAGTTVTNLATVPAYGGFGGGGTYLSQTATTPGYTQQLTADQQANLAATGDTAISADMLQ